MDYQRDRSTASLYLHWPFCPYKCHFCPFVALAAHDEYMVEYHQALCQELKTFAMQAPRERIETVYLGGGTPSTYPPELLLDTFGILKEYYSFSPEAEITLEVNPGTVSEQKLQAWSQAGINRLSVGVQSLNDKVLRDLNRHQAARDVEELMEKAGPLFDNISIDLILGLPGIADDEWKAYLHKVVSWPIKHLSMYFLTVHENTPLYFGVKRQKYVLPPDESVVDLYEWSVAFLAQAGFEQYEISNFARPGYASRHNSIYWQRLPYKGFGLGACSFDGARRFQNDKNLLSYLRKARAGESLSIFAEELSDQQEKLEVCMLTMRLRKGFDVASLMTAASPVARAAAFELLHDMADRGYIVLNGSVVTMTARGLSVENELVVRLSEIFSF